MATAIKACLASSAMLRDVETTQPRCVPPVFPSTGDTTCRCPLPSTVSWAQFPRFGGTMRHSDSSPSFPPRFVAFARRYHPSTCGFAPSDARCCVHGLGLGEPVPAPRRSLRWRREASRVPGKPTRTHATRSDPGEVAASTASEMRRDSLPSNARRRPSQTMHFGAQSRGLRAPCERFAPWVTPGPRITRFWRPTLAGWDWIPTGFRTRFRRSHHAHLVLLDRAGVGACRS